MKKTYLLAIGLSMAIIMTGCGVSGEKHVMTKSEDSDVQTMSDAPEDNTEADNGNEAEDEDNGNDGKNTSGDEARELGSTELSELEDMFADLKYEAFLDFGFDDVTMIPWDDVVYYEAQNLWTAADDEKESIYLDTVGKTVDEYLGVIAYVEKSKLEDFCLTYTGSDYSNARFPLTWLYIPECDAYFYEVTDCADPTYEIMSGTVDGNTYTIEALDPTLDYNKSRTFTFTMDGDDVKVVSNTIHWEEGSDDSYTFDSEIYGESTIYTYGTSANLITYGNQQDYLNIGYMNHNMKSIDDIYFFDFNADGIKDIVIIGDSDDGELVSVTYSDTYYGRYTYKLNGIDDGIKNVAAGDLSEDNLKAVLLKYGNNGSYASYQEAYSQVAYLSSLCTEKYNYGLQDIDGDGVQELILSEAGDWSTWIYVYTYKNGFVVKESATGASNSTLDSTELSGYDNVTFGQLDTSLTYETLISTLNG